MGWVAPQSEIEAVLREHPAVKARCLQVAESVAASAQLIGAAEAYDTGRYVSLIRAEATARGARARAAALHSAALEGGTGLFGPFGRMIRAAPGRRFAFTTRLPPPAQDQVLAKGLGGVERRVVISEHRGMPARHIMERAARAVAAASPGLRYRRGAWEVVD